MTTRALATEWLRQLWLIRCFEEHVARLSKAGEVPGFVHLCSGQEAVAVGVCTVLGEGDYVFSSHRGHGHFLARGSDPYRLLAEILGRADGLCGGYGGSMHLVDAAQGLLGATGVVGGNLPLCAGAAWAAAETGRGQVAVVFFGDGASGAGVFHETLNLAALWRLPVLFVCENNGYAEFTSRAEHSIVKHVSEFCTPYGIPAALVDGNDVLAVQAAAAARVAATRNGEGPQFLECLTYRLSGHYVGDPMHYRDKEEMGSWAARDPIPRLHRHLVALGTDEAALARIEREVRDALGEVVARVLAAPPPDPGSVLERVYAADLGARA